MLGQHAQDLDQLHVLAAEYVAASRAAPLGSQDVALRHVVDIDDVERCVDVGGDAPVQEVDDELAGRRRGAITLPEGERGMGDDDR